MTKFTGEYAQFILSRILWCPCEGRAGEGRGGGAHTAEPGAWMLTRSFPCGKWSGTGYSGIALSLIFLSECLFPPDEGGE